MYCDYCESLDFKNNICNKYGVKIVSERLTDSYTMRDDEYFYKCNECKNEISNSDVLKEKDVLCESNININEKGGDVNMFEGFGKIQDNSVAITFNGQIAIRRNENEYVRYNKETQTIENQMNMVIKDSTNFVFILPVSQVEVDDIVKLNKSYYQVLEVKDDGEITAVNINDGSKGVIVKETSVIGFSFYYKVVSLLSSATNDNSINPMMLMMMNGNSGNDMNGLLMAQMMNGQSSAKSINPMMLMAMSCGGMDIQSLMLMNMMNGNQ